VQCDEHGAKAFIQMSGVDLTARPIGLLGEIECIPPFDLNQNHIFAIPQQGFNAVPRKQLVTPKVNRTHSEESRAFRLRGRFR
jgi:hypothetical protein